LTRDHLNEDDQDILRELSNIAAGYSATALGKMVGKTIDINIPEVRIIPVDKLPKIFDNADEWVVVVVCALTEAPRALLVLVIPSETVLLIIKNMVGEDVRSITDLSSINESALQEIGNILAGAYVTALSETIGQRVTHSYPGIVVGKNGMIQDCVSHIMNGFVPYVMIFTHFSDKQKELALSFLTVANMETVDFIFSKMGMS